VLVSRELGVPSPVAWQEICVRYSILRLFFFSPTGTGQGEDLLPI